MTLDEFVSELSRLSTQRQGAERGWHTQRFGDGGDCPVTIGLRHGDEDKGIGCECPITFVANRTRQGRPWATQHWRDAARELGLGLDVGLQIVRAADGDGNDQLRDTLDRAVAA